LNEKVHVLMFINYWTLYAFQVVWSCTYDTICLEKIP